MSDERTMELLKRAVETLTIAMMPGSMIQENLELTEEECEELGIDPTEFFVSN